MGREDERNHKRKKNIRVRLINLGTLGQLAVGLQTPSLIGTILEYDITFFVLIVAQAEQDNVALVDPNFFT